VGASAPSSDGTPIPDWLAKALKNVPEGTEVKCIERLYIARDVGSWTGEDLALLAWFPNLKDLEVAGRLAPGALCRLKELERLERIRLYSDLTEENLKSLARLPGLKSLVLPCSTCLTETGMKYLSESESLEDLEIPYISDINLVRPLGGMKSLKVLRFPVSPVTEAKMRAVAELKGPAALEIRLDLPRGQKPEDLLAPLRGMANLKGLSLHDWPLNAAALEVVQTLTHLERLDLKEAKLRDPHLAYLSHLTNLRELNLALTRISDVGLGHLRRLVALEKLDLTGAQLTDACRDVLGNLVNLKELNLTNSPDARFHDHKGIGDATLGALGRLEKLQRLDLWSNNVSIAGLAYLVDLKNLECLNLCRCRKVNDQALMPVGRITSLRELHLDYTAVTDKGIRFLTGLKNLRTLTLVKCNVDIQTTMAVLKDLKGLEVTFSGSRPFVEYETLTVGGATPSP